MNKPCCHMCRGPVSKAEGSWPYCYSPSCKCHLPKEKCTCGEPHISDMVVHCYDGKPCYVGQPTRDVQPPAPERVCKCACHENRLGHHYIHDTECCETMNGYVEAPAPEKKWEELLLKAHVYDEFRYYDAEGEPTRWKVDYEKLKAIIASILEEKAVEVEGLKQNLPQRPCINAEMHMFGRCFECEKGNGYNTALQHAAAILRR